MHEFFINNPTYAIIFLLVVIAIALYLAVKIIQTIGLEKVRSYVYDAFVEAEHEFKHGENEQKFEYVIQLARSMLPKPFCFFITEGVLRKTVQLWFDLCKDLLDDGSLNGSGRSNE